MKKIIISVTGNKIQIKAQTDQVVDLPSLSKTDTELFFSKEELEAIIDEMKQSGIPLDPDAISSEQLTAFEVDHTLNNDTVLSLDLKHLPFGKQHLDLLAAGLERRGFQFTLNRLSADGQSEEVAHLAKINTHFDPYRQLKVVSFNGRSHMPCRKAISFMAANLLEGHNKSEAAIDVEKIYTDINSDERGLVINFGEKNLAQAQALATALSFQGFQFASCDDKGNFSISSTNEADAEAVHQEIGRFITYTLGTWKIPHHNYLRDIYCDNSGNEKGINVSEDKKAALRDRFNQVHFAHKNPGLRVKGVSKLTSLSFLRAKTYDKIDPQSYYYLMNATIHAMQLSKRQPQQQLTKQEKEEASAPKSHEGEITIITNGDYFEEIAGATDGDRVAVLGADNGFRPGGAALVAGPGSIEEMFCRVSDYLTMLNSHLDETHPLRTLMENVHLTVEATDRTIKLPPAGTRGFPNNLAGQLIPEYLTREEVEYLMEHTNKLSHAVAGLEGTKAYSSHKRTDDWAPVTENVLVNTPQGSQRVAVVGMVGIDGRDPGIIGRQNSTEQELAENKSLRDQGADGMLKEYKRRYKKAIFHLLQNSDGRPRTKAILVAVGAGAFDPTPDKRYAAISAEAFAEVLGEESDLTIGEKRVTPFDYIREHKIQVSFPFLERDQVVRKKFTDQLKSKGIHFIERTIPKGKEETMSLGS